MNYDLTAGEQHLNLLQTLIPSNEQFFIWGYTLEQKCIGATCPEEERELLDTCFRLFCTAEKLSVFTGNPETAKPFIIGSPAGLQWGAIPDQSRSSRVVIIIGPVFYSAPDSEKFAAALRPFISRLKRPSFPSDMTALIPEIPVMSYAIFSRYVILINNTVNEQQLGLGDLRHESETDKGIRPHPAETRDRTKVYQAERAMLQMVREGNINYQNILQRVIANSPGVPVRGDDPLTGAKTNLIVFTSLVCRAAMEGGLSPEIAYSLGDSYIQTVADCRDSGELSSLAHVMYHDFIYRVHQLHANPNYSHAIQKCCDYIELNLDKKIRSSDLANLVSYTEYYLTHKFKKETGQSVSAYIRSAKIERARLLLRTTDKSIQSIADELAFNTPNYFIQSFREVNGCTPAQYREQYKDKQ